MPDASAILNRTTFWLCLPVACAWVRRQESRIVHAGIPLTRSQLSDARTIGVEFPERVRLLAVDEVPAMHPVLRLIANRIGLCSPHTRGMSLRYGIFVHSDWSGERRLVVHELVHTRQYERLGLRRFLKRYLYECIVTPGYPFGGLEQEAIRIEQEMCGRERN